MWHVLATDKHLKKFNSPEKKEEIARGFLVFQYLRSYHSAVYRLLERQPKAFLYLWQILNAAGTTDGAMEDKGQRLLKDMLYRAFSHVLDHHGEADDKHGTESIDSAIEQFLQRQDKKRSDEYFKELLTELFNEDSAGNLPSFYFSTACSADIPSEANND